MRETPIAKFQGMDTDSRVEWLSKSVKDTGLSKGDMFKEKKIDLIVSSLRNHGPMTTRELSSHTHGDDNGRGLNNYMSTRGKKLNLEDHGIYRHYVKGFGKAYVWFLEEHLSEEDLAKAKRKRRKEERAAKAAAKSTSPTEEPAQPQSTEEHTDQMPTLY